MNEMLDIPFRGERPYLHGPDLFDATCDLLTAQGLLSSTDMLVFSFRRFATKAVALTRDIHEAPVATWTIGGRSGALIETDQPVTRRIPYPESRITEVCRVEGRTCSADPSTACLFSSMQIAVALTKLLHQRCLDDKAKWIVVGISLNRPIQEPECTALSVELAHTAGPLTRTDLLIRDQSLGSLLFTRHS